MKTVLMILHTRLNWYYSTPIDEREVSLYQQASRYTLKYFSEILFLVIAICIAFDMAMLPDVIVKHTAAIFMFIIYSAFMISVFIGGRVYAKQKLMTQPTLLSVIRIFVLILFTLAIVAWLVFEFFE